MEDSMSFVQGAALPCIYATALMALVDKANLQRDRCPTRLWWLHPSRRQSSVQTVVTCSWVDWAAWDELLQSEWRRMAQDIWSSFRDLRKQDQGPIASWKSYVLKDANYTAANTLLNAFVQYRNHNGLVTSVIGVGVMGGVGFASQNQDVLERLGRICIGRCREDACHREGAGRRPCPNFLIKDEDFIALNRPFESLGMDALVAMEVRNRLRQQVGVESSTIAMTQNPSLLDLSEHVKLVMAGGD
ncbi:putative Lovastatin diketide synthase LovF [Seiridium cardinale]